MRRGDHRRVPGARADRRAGGVFSPGRNAIAGRQRRASRPAHLTAVAGTVFAISAALAAATYFLKGPLEILVLAIVGCVIALAMFAAAAHI